MIVHEVNNDIEATLKNQILRKKKDDELMKERAKQDAHRVTIEKLKENIEKRAQDLEVQKEQLESHRKFTEFLEAVVKNNALGGANGEQQTIDMLRGRFINLKTENKKLKHRKSAIDNEMEQVRIHEREQLSQMTNVLYNKSKEMQQLQKQIEDFQHRNTSLDLDFENEINKKNRNKKEVGELINSINNIANIKDLSWEIRQRAKGSKEVAPVHHEEIVIKNMVDSLNNSAREISELTNVYTKMQKLSQAEEASKKAPKQVIEPVHHAVPAEKKAEKATGKPKTRSKFTTVEMQEKE